jgi:simple sugar transport system permease protein
VIETILIISVIAGAFRLGTPMLFVALGEIFAERAGILNISTEGMMILGAFSGFMGAYITGSLVIGVLVGILVGVLVGLLMAFFSVNLKADQVVSGFALTLVGIALSSYIYRAYFGIPAFYPAIEGFKRLEIPFLSQIPIVGKAIFSQNILVYLAIILVPIFYFILYHTVYGLNIRAVGENPSAADTAGVNVALVRYSCLIIGGAMAGLGGSALTLGISYLFKDEITAFRGWIAIAIVQFGGWNPAKVFGFSLMFGAAETIVFTIQAAQVIQAPAELLIMIPYVLTVLVLIVTAIRKWAGAPAALAIPYKRGER